MKKNVNLLIFILFIFIVSGCLHSKNNDNKNDLDNNVLIKGKEGFYSSIMDAIDKSVDGDIILVGEGIYNERVSIYKSVTLKGENKENTIIDADESGDGIYISADSVKISGFTIKNSGNKSYPYVDAGIDIRSNNNTIIHNNIVFNGNYGIYIKSSHSNIISNNNISSNGDSGIYIYLGSNNTFTNNTVSNNTYGIYGEGIYSNHAYGTNISANIVSSNSKKGIYLNQYYNCTLNDNIISNNGDGIYIKASENNKILDNLFEHNQIGLFFCCGGRNNVVFNNVFINNSVYNAKSNCINQWDFKGIGNYWDNYTGVDNDEDGIGDTPHDIPHNEHIDVKNQDRYPLMEP